MDRHRHDDENGRDESQAQRQRGYLADPSAADRSPAVRSSLAELDGEAGTDQTADVPGVAPGQAIKSLFRGSWHDNGLYDSFDRFPGYAQVPASLLTALADLRREPERRLPHDRLAGTLVVRGERGAGRALTARRRRT